jgi:hypothetical protein
MEEYTKIPVFIQFGAEKKYAIENQNRVVRGRLGWFGPG